MNSTYFNVEIGKPPIDCSVIITDVAQVIETRIEGAAQTVVGSGPEPAPMLVDTSASMWMKKTRLPC